MSDSASNVGYAAEADSLFVRYESRDAASIHAPWARFFPKSPARILDIGAGTGRDAGWFASLGHSVLAVEPTDPLRRGAAKLHPAPELTWLDDRLPGLEETRARGANVASLLAPGGRIAMRLRHGEVPEGRRMFNVTGAETIALAAKHGLRNLMQDRAESIQAENRAKQNEWTTLVFEKT